MSDNEINGAGSDETINGISPADVKFLVTCLKNTAGGQIAVDTIKVADALGYKNHKSVSNKVALMKKKYDLPFGSTASVGKGAGTPDKAGKTPTPRKASDAAGPTDPAIPKTPAKTRVTKPRATSSTKKKAVSKKANSQDDVDERMEEQSDEAADTKEEYEKVFGKASDDEEIEDNEVEDEDEDSKA